MDAELVRKVRHLVKIAIPGWLSTEALMLYGLTVMLGMRTYLSIQLAAINGGIVKTIVNRDFKLFTSRCLFLLAFSVPASTVNSSLEYFNKRIAIQFRKRLNSHFNKEYLSKKIFYQMSNLDNRI